MKYTKIITVITVAAVLLAPVHFTSSLETPITTAPVVAPAIAEAAVLGIPTNLSIPNAKVTTNIIEVGITPKGNLDVPGNYTEVGWYKYGARPGEIGSAVLDGHVDNGGSIPGPFKHLRDVKNGDDIFVTMSTGQTLHYKVTASQAYPLSQFPAKEVFHQTGKQYLKIITCHGTFVPSIHTYDQRLIVTAELVV